MHLLPKVRFHGNRSVWCTRKWGTKNKPLPAWCPSPRQQGTLQFFLTRIPQTETCNQQEFCWRDCHGLIWCPNKAGAVGFFSNHSSFMEVALTWHRQWWSKASSSSMSGSSHCMLEEEQQAGSQQQKNTKIVMLWCYYGIGWRLPQHSPDSWVNHSAINELKQTLSTACALSRASKARFAEPEARTKAIINELIGIYVFTLTNCE